MNLIEPLGLLAGRSAAEAIEAGLALPLAGGPAAFTLVRLHGGGRGVVAVNAIPETFADSLTQVTRPPPHLGGTAAGTSSGHGHRQRDPGQLLRRGGPFDTARAIASGRAMEAAGADIVDVGGESTRPAAQPLDPGIEQARVLPVIRALHEAGVMVSIDTRNAATMAAALDAGARIVNDVSGLRYDSQAASLVRARGCPVVVMHMRGTPQTMQSLTHYDDVALDVLRELSGTVADLALAPGQVAVDPGIGFAKGPGQNEALLARLPLLLNLGCPILVGLSRKGFIGRIVLEATPQARLAGSLAGACAALLAGAAILRVHDVPETLQAVKVWQAIWSSI